MTLRQVLGCPQPKEWRLDNPEKWGLDSTTHGLTFQRFFAGTTT